jgi:cytosine deaminase
MTATDEDLTLMRAALDEARAGLAEGGIPIGAVLAVDGEIVGRGRNRRVQQRSAILHGETDCLERAGRLRATIYRRATIYSTLSPCHLCTGAILLFRIPRVVIAENRNFKGPEELLAGSGVEVANLDLAEAVEMMRRFIREHPDLWNEDIGE